MDVEAASYGFRPLNGGSRMGLKDFSLFIQKI